MKRFLLVLAIFFSAYTGTFAAYPYDSVCQIAVKAMKGYNCGSASLVAVSEKHALLLSCQHVCGKSGNEVQVLWPATGETCLGRVLKVGARGFDGRHLDIAICICPRPKGLRPIPVAYPNSVTSGTLTNAGFPGCTGTLEWQQGTLNGIDYDQIYYSCRPIPGMSGGVTFDQWGNQVGVVVAYGRQYGFSTSGKAMAHFLADYMINHKVKKWSPGEVQEKVMLEAPPTEDMIRTPKDFEEFKEILAEDYKIIVEPMLEPAAEDTELKEAATLEVREKRVRKSVTGRRSFRRRLFRRRR